MRRPRGGTRAQRGESRLARGLVAVERRRHGCVPIKKDAYVLRSLGCRPSASTTPSRKSRWGDGDAATARYALARLVAVDTLDSRVEIGTSHEIDAVRAPRAANQARAGRAGRLLRREGVLDGSQQLEHHVDHHPRLDDGFGPIVDKQRLLPRGSSPGAPDHRGEKQKRSQGPAWLRSSRGTFPVHAREASRGPRSSGGSSCTRCACRGTWWHAARTSRCD